MAKSYGNQPRLVVRLIKSKSRQVYSAKFSSENWAIKRQTLRIFPRRLILCCDRKIENPPTNQVLVINILSSLSIASEYWFECVWHEKFMRLRNVACKNWQILSNLCHGIFIAFQRYASNCFQFVSTFSRSSLRYAANNCRKLQKPSANNGRDLLELKFDLQCLNSSREIAIEAVRIAAYGMNVS